MLRQFERPSDERADISPRWSRASATYRRGYGLGRVLRIPVEADWSLLLIFALVTLNLGIGWLPRWHPDWSTLTRWGTALGAASLFLVSLLLHELSHALTARAHGIGVRRITLFLFGGMTQLEREAQSPRSELWIALAGPVTSIVIGAAAFALGATWAGLPLADGVWPETLGEAGPIPTLLLWLGSVNLTLAVFNLMPGFPLDGGRALRALFWAITDDMERATRWASRAGQAFALLLVACGLVCLFADALLAGGWLILIGWFLNRSARTSYRALLLRQASSRVTVARIMKTDLRRLRPGVSLDRFARERLPQKAQQYFPVESDDGRLLGIVRGGDLNKVPRALWARATVSTVMTRPAEIVTLGRDLTAETALRELTRRDIEQLPVLEDEQMVGLVSRGALLQWLAHQNGSVSHAPTSQR